MRDGQSKAGMTLVEVMVGFSLLSLLLAAVYGGVTQAVQATYVAAQRTAAFGLCKERLEQMRGADYANVSMAFFPNQAVQITHLGGATRVPLMGTISNSIVILAGPARKQVTVGVHWVFRGRNVHESLTGCVVNRDAAAAAIGSCGGQVNLHPNSSWPSTFKLWKPDGTTIDKAKLQSSSFTGYQGPATHVRYKASGIGTQTSLLYNFQPFPMSNAKQWDIEASALQVNLRKVSGKWTIAITGNGAVITSR